MGDREHVVERRVDLGDQRAALPGSREAAAAAARDGERDEHQQRGSVSAELGQGKNSGTLCLRSGVTGRESQPSIMGARRTIRRATGAAACLALLGACHADGKHERQRAPSQAPRIVAPSAVSGVVAEQPRPAPTPVPLAPAVAQTLRSLREQRLEIAPPPTQSALLTFGLGRLLQASWDKATFRDSKQGQVITEASIGAVRAVAHGADGSLFAVGASEGARLDPRAKTAKHFPHVTFLPGSRLLPDLKNRVTSSSTTRSRSNSTPTPSKARPVPAYRSRPAFASRVAANR